MKLAFDQEQLFLPPENGYEILLTVRAQDEDGNPYFRESASVRIRAEGPAEIMAVDRCVLETALSGLHRIRIGSGCDRKGRGYLSSG